MVGTQVWQTLEGSDITALNMTEMSEDAFESFFLAMSCGFTKQGVRNKITTSNNRLNTSITSDVTGVIRIPGLSRSVGPKFAKFTDISENAYLLAGAPHQSVKIRVYTASSLPLNITNLNLRLFGQCIVMCNEEREQIKAMPAGLPKRLKMTQNVNQSFDCGTLASGNVIVEKNCKLDLDHFSLFASHIIIAIHGEGTHIANSSIKNAELKLNSSSFSGVLDGALLTGSAADALGLYSNAVMKGTANYSANYYVFPLASHAYGGSSVPLNRFDNIRLEVTAAIQGDSGGGSNSEFEISATCVGETTALYKGGAASLAMY